MATEATSQPAPGPPAAPKRQVTWKDEAVEAPQLDTARHRFLLYRVRFMAAGFWLLFNSYSSTQFLQTSLNGGLGYQCLGILYFLFAVVALGAPFVIGRLQPRIVIPASALAYMWVVAANIHVVPAALLSGCGAVGIAAALLWSSQGLFVTRASVAYASATGVSVSDAATLMNSAFFFIFTSSGGASYLLSSLVLLFAPDGVALLFLILVGIGTAGVLLLTCLESPDDVSHSRVVAPPCFLVAALRGRAGLGAAGAPTVAATSTASSTAPPPIGGVSGSARESVRRDLLSSAGGDGATATSSVDTRPISEEVSTATAAAEAAESGAAISSAPAPAPAPTPALLAKNAPPPSVWYMLRFLLTERRALLMTPAVLAFGAQMGAFNTLWIGTLVGGGVGPAYVGFIGCAYSWSTSLATWAWGRAVKRPGFGRRWAFAYSAGLYLLFWGASMLWVAAYPPGGPPEARPPVGGTIVFLLAGAAVYAAADGVWYVQVPAVLQTMYSQGPDASCVNAAIRLYTSLGFAVQSAISVSVGPGSQLPQQFAGVAAFLVVACASLAYLHVTDVDIDNGQSRTAAAPAAAAAAGGGNPGAAGAPPPLKRSFTARTVARVSAAFVERPGSVRRMALS